MNAHEQSFWFGQFVCSFSGAYVDLKMVVGTNLTSATLSSDAVFAGIKDRIAADPAKAKSVNAIFSYKITNNGQVAKEWSKCDEKQFKRDTLDFVTYYMYTFNGSTFFRSVGLLVCVVQPVNDNWFISSARLFWRKK